MKSVFKYLDSTLNLTQNDIVVIANSSGPDSMALMNILLKLRSKKGLKIICAHVNHNVRKESYEEAEFLKEYCNRNDVIFEYMIIDKYGEDNFHNEARTIRYSFFIKILE